MTKKHRLPKAQEAIRKIKKLRKGTTLGKGLSIKKLLVKKNPF